MSTQSDKRREQNRGSTSEASQPGAGGLGQAQAQLDELLELGEISREAFAEYSNHGSHFQFADTFNRYAIDFLDRQTTRP